MLSNSPSDVATIVRPEIYQNEHSRIQVAHRHICNNEIYNTNIAQFEAKFAFNVILYYFSPKLFQLYFSCKNNAL